MRPGNASPSTAGTAAGAAAPGTADEPADETNAATTNTASAASTTPTSTFDAVAVRPEQVLGGIGIGAGVSMGSLMAFGVTGDESASVIGPSTIFLYSGGVGLLNVLLLSILATLAAFIYNLAADLTGGGVQVTLSDRRN